MGTVIYEIQPHVGAGDLKFNMTAQEIRTLLGADAETFKLTPHTAHPVDYFRSKGIVVHYDTQSKCEAIEFYGPDSPQLEQKRLLGIATKSAENWLEDADPDAQVDPPDITSEKLSTAFYVRDGKVTSVLVFRDGYFEE